MPVGDPQFNRQQDQTNASRVSLGGGGIRANNYLLDGVPITELRGRAVLNPTIEAVEEVKVQVHTYDAEMGRTGGGVFNVTAKSGTNEYHGSGFYQTRPVWGQSENFFNAVAGMTKEETGTGRRLLPPVRRRRRRPDCEEPHVLLGRDRGLSLGDDAEPAGDLAEPESAQRRFLDVDDRRRTGRLFNPWCRGGVANARCPATGTGSIATGGLFTGAIIPLTHPAVSQVGFNILKLWPTETINGSDGVRTRTATRTPSRPAFIVDKAQMYTFKGEHKFTDKWSLSGLYIYNKTDEPGSTIMQADKLFMADQGQWFGPLRRRPHVLVFNNTNIINDTTVLTLRYGWTTWQDSCDKQPFSAGPAVARVQPELRQRARSGRQRYVSVAHVRRGRETSAAGAGYRSGGRARMRSTARCRSCVGSHSFKVGADIRRLGDRDGDRVHVKPRSAGAFEFNPRLHQPERRQAATNWRACCSGCRLPGRRRHDPRRVRVVHAHTGAATSRTTGASTRSFTLNYGLRLEHEDGLREIENRQTVAFDRNAINPIDALVPKAGTLLAGQDAQGRPGLRRRRTARRRSRAIRRPIKPAPRVGATYAVDTQDRRPRRLRAVLGAVEVPRRRSTARSASRGRRR